MSLGTRLLNLRKSKQLSQEEVADKLSVTRQTVSKWETDQSTPDFDKIMPLCELYEITADELLTGKNQEEVIESSIVTENELNVDIDYNKRKFAQGIGKAILLYFLAIAWIMIMIPVFLMNPIVASAIFLLICGVATYVMVYTCIVYKKEKVKIENQENKLLKRINSILSLITTIIYLIISFMTMAWHITWIIWIIYALIMEIVKLVFTLRGTNDEK